MYMKPWFKNVLIFVLIFIFFLLLQGWTTFADPDCFYNTKMALMMKDELVFKEFPWLQYSVLKDNYIDHHLLYHIFLMPFVSLEKIGVDPLLGVRISAMLFATLLIFVFYLILKKFKIKYPLLFVGLLLVANPFVFRISLARAPAISGVFLLLGTYLIIAPKNFISSRWRNIFLFIISFFYVWLYSAWLLLPVILFFYLVGTAIDQGLREKLGIKLRWWSGWWKNIMRAIRENAGKIVVCASGIVAGLIINPYFPANLKFYYHQIVQISVVNFHSKFGVGSEWYPPEPVALFKILFLFFVALLVAIAIFFAFRKMRDKRTWTLFLITFFFFAYTMKARRSVEYLVPFGVFFIALVYDNLLDKKSWPELEAKFKKFFTNQQRKILIALVSVLVFVAPYFIYHGIANNRKSLRNFKFNHFQDVSSWLKENVEPGQVVFNSNWDSFGYLFYHNSDNYYITGLDQTFMYSYDPELLELYIDITNGLGVKTLRDDVENKFNSEYILALRERNQNLYRRLKMLSKDFELVFEGEELSVFKIKSKRINADN